MLRLRHLLAGWCALLCSIAHGQVTQETTIETYFLDSSAHRGPYHYLSWGQTNVRFSDAFKATVSGLTTGGANTFDEACVSYEKGDRILRVGRFKTAFGFSNWSEVFYNGFNHIPLVRIAPLADDLTLTRDDAGAEVTLSCPVLQVQAAVVDTELGPAQLGPKHLDHASLRLQTSRGGFILGADVLASISGSNNIYGLDARWTIPRLVVRGELMAGHGPEQSSWGYYVDAAYRIPKLTRTQAVARIDGVSYGANSEYYTQASSTALTTIGIRQVVSPNFTVNLNYGWGTGAAVPYVTANGLRGWTLRTMFQLHF